MVIQSCLECAVKMIRVVAWDWCGLALRTVHTPWLSDDAGWSTHLIMTWDVGSIGDLAESTKERGILLLLRCYKQKDIMLKS